MNNCNICPRECGADRENGKRGYCGQTSRLRLARAALHMWEEPCISGINGAGAVFFCGCNLRCVYCQNRVISDCRFEDSQRVGKEVSVNRLADIFLELQGQSASCIDLVTPAHFVLQIRDALILAKERGLNIPVVYNTSAYEKVETLMLLDGLVDVYMPDLKYYSGELSMLLSDAPDYWEVATAAISEMYRQVGRPVITSEDSSAGEGLLIKGVLIRHLVLPGQSSDSKKILKSIYDIYGDNVYVSIMNQYTPLPFMCEWVNENAVDENINKLSNTLNPRVYERVVDYCIELGYINAFIQEGETNKESFIPIWDATGV